MHGETMRFIEKEWSLTGISDGFFSGSLKALHISWRRQYSGTKRTTAVNGEVLLAGTVKEAKLIPAAICLDCSDVSTPNIYSVCMHVKFHEWTRQLLSEV